MRSEVTISFTVHHDTRAQVSALLDLLENKYSKVLGDLEMTEDLIERWTVKTEQVSG